jgi:hypothetical protein
VGVGLNALDDLLSVAALVAPITRSCVRLKGVGEARIPLELQSRDGLLVAGHEENPEEPDLQGNPGLVKDGPGRERNLVAAGLALLHTPSLDRIAPAMTAARVHEAPRPARAP